MLSRPRSWHASASASSRLGIGVHSSHAYASTRAGRPVAVAPHAMSEAARHEDFVARVALVSARHGDGVRDGVGRAAPFFEGQASGIDCDLDAGGSEAGVEIGD